MGCNSKKIHNIGNEKCKDDYELIASVKGKMCIFDGELSNKFEDVEFQTPTQTNPIDENDADDESSEDEEGSSPSSQVDLAGIGSNNQGTTGGVERNLPHFTLLVMVAYLAM